MGSLLKYLDSIPSSFVLSARISSSVQSLLSVKNTDLNHADVQVPSNHYYIGSNFFSYTKVLLVS